jgi:hypothetical protein
MQTSLLVFSRKGHMPALLSHYRWGGRTDVPAAAGVGRRWAGLLCTWASIACRVSTSGGSACVPGGRLTPPRCVSANCTPLHPTPPAQPRHSPSTTTATSPAGLTTPSTASPRTSTCSAAWLSTMESPRCTCPSASRQRSPSTGTPPPSLAASEARPLHSDSAAQRASGGLGPASVAGMWEPAVLPAGVGGRWRCCRGQPRRAC